MSAPRARSIRVLEYVAAVAAVALVTVVIVTRHHHTTRGHGSPASTLGAQGASAVVSSPGSSGSGDSSTGSGSQAATVYLPQIERTVMAARQTSFKAVYQANGQPTTLSFAQVGSQSSFSTGPTSYYANGRTTTICDSSSGRPICYVSSPLTGLLSLVSPANEANAIQEALIAGVRVTHSNERHDGEMSSCVAYAKSGQQVKYCTDDQGIVTFIKLPAGAFVLTSYSTNVSDADVSLPPDAEIVAAPGNSS